jgi:hypothetical protein
MKTGGVKSLVRRVLDTLPTPYTEHVIDDVLHAIEHDRDFFEEYNLLSLNLGRHVVNNWCGQWVANALGKTGKQQVPARRSTLVGSYSLLDADAKPAQRRPKEDEALKLMFDYYRTNRANLQADIRLHRDALVELIMAGVPPEDAFAAVQSVGEKH